MAEAIYESIKKLFIHSKQGTTLSLEKIAALLNEKSLVKRKASSYDVLNALVYGLKNEEFFRFDIRVKYINPLSRKNPPATFIMDGRPLGLTQIKRVNAIEKEYEKAKRKKKN